MVTRPMPQNTAALRKGSIGLDQVEDKLLGKSEYIKFKNDSNKIRIVHSQEVISFIFWGTDEEKGRRGSFFDGNKNIHVKYMIFSNDPNTIVFESCFIDNINPGQNRHGQQIIENNEELMAAIRYVAKRDKYNVSASSDMEWLRDEINRRESQSTKV